MDRDAGDQWTSVELRPATANATDTKPAAAPSFADLFEHHFDYVWNALRRLGIPADELEDTTHDTFLQVFRQLAAYDPARPAKPWLFGFAFRVASAHRKKRLRRPAASTDSVELPDPGAGSYEQLALRQRLELAQRVLDAMDLDQRAVFILHELDGFTMQEVAASVGIPLATAYSRLRLARQAFESIARRLQARER